MERKKKSRPRKQVHVYRLRERKETAEKAYPRNVDQRADHFSAKEEKARENCGIKGKVPGN